MFFFLNSTNRPASVKDSVEASKSRRRSVPLCACVSVRARRQLCPLQVHRHRARWGGSAWPSLADMEDVWRREKRKKKCLTGVGAQCQRGLETPGVEVRGSSLKHERHRQGNKHDLPPASCFDANNVRGVRRRAASSSEVSASWSASLVDSSGRLFGTETSQHSPLGVYTCSPGCALFFFLLFTCVHVDRRPALVFGVNVHRTYIKWSLECST